MAIPKHWAGRGSGYAMAALYEWLGCLLSLACLAVFAVLKAVICLDPSEHLSPAAFWSCIPVPGEIPGLAEKRVLGNSLLKLDFKAASVWEECYCLRIISVHI